MMESVTEKTRWQSQPRHAHLRKTDETGMCMFTHRPGRGGVLQFWQGLITLWSRMTDRSRFPSVLLLLSCAHHSDFHVPPHRWLGLTQDVQTNSLIKSELMYFLLLLFTSVPTWPWRSSSSLPGFLSSIFCPTSCYPSACASDRTTCCPASPQFLLQSSSCHFLPWWTSCFPASSFSGFLSTLLRSCCTFSHFLLHLSPCTTLRNLTLSFYLLFLRICTRVSCEDPN